MSAAIFSTAFDLSSSYSPSRYLQECSRIPLSLHRLLVYRAGSDPMSKINILNCDVEVGRGVNPLTHTLIASLH